FVARAGAAAASALHCAHAHGTLHRDVKPGNFLLDQEDELWVTDFGLAKALESEGLTNSGDLLGTLQYMAPEQFAGAYDVRSEVYALGVTLYEMLTLAPAFAGQQRSELMELVRDQRFEPLAKACPEAPHDLTVIIGKAMSRDPNERYADAQALQHDLEAFVEDRPISATRPSAWSLMKRWCRRNRVVASVVLAATALVVVAGVAGWVFYVREQAAKELARSEGQRAERNLEISERALRLAQSEGERAENNLRLSLDAFADVFDALAGRDPVLDFEEDPGTGEETVVVQSTVRQDDVLLLQEMLSFYDRFATENADSDSLRYETARANRRVGAIHAQLGEPASLETAQAAFEKALDGFSAIEDRDVRRDVANVHIDLGKLSERRRRIGAARTHFETALAILVAVPNAASPAVRLRRAEVLFELYRVRDRARFRRDGPLGSDHFFAAMALLGELLRTDGDNPDVRALQGRCLREEARGIGGSAAEAQVVEIFRDLAEKYDRLEFRLEFCRAVLTRARRPGRVSLADLEKAEEMAARLFADQPLFGEHRSLLLQVQTRRASALYRETDGMAPAEILARQQEARAILLGALSAQEVAGGEGLVDLRFVTSLINCRANLALFELVDGDRAAALQQANLSMDLFEKHLKALGTMPPSQQGRAEVNGRRIGRRSNWLRGWLGDDWAQLVDFGLVLKLLGDEALNERVRALSNRR
ncbi:MAG: serine/threonine-protein kinase, partial [Planctomycetota bacterium]|nr:serine/threonine-protein kinase [Planctomycetota bacterium]